MIDASLGERFYVSGRFPGLKKEEIWTRLLATGAHGVMSKSVATAYLCSDPSDPKLMASGKPLYTIDDLPATLDGWLEQLKGAVAHCRAEHLMLTRRGVIAVDHFAYGPPADDALVARIEAHIGYALPEDVRSLMRQFNGVSCVLGIVKAKGGPIELPDTVLPAGALLDTCAPLWAGHIEWLMGVIAIPTWEEIFLSAHKFLYDPSVYGAREKLKIGSLKVIAEDLFPRAFDLDLFHAYAGAMLYIDPKGGESQVIYSVDHGADFTSAHPLTLRCYMDSLAAGIWTRMSHAEQRPIKPVSKAAWPTYIHNVHGAPYVFIKLT